MKKKQNFYNKIINRCNWTNLTRENINIYVYTTIGKLPSVQTHFIFITVIQGSCR